LHVPNFVPEPIEIPGNVTERSYNVQLSFIRRLELLFLLSLGGILAFYFGPLPTISLRASATFVGGAILILSGVRLLMRKSEFEAVISISMLPAVLAGFALLFRALEREGVPVHAPLAGILCGVIYTLACKNDFSFVGQFMLSLIPSSVFLSIWGLARGESPQYVSAALALNAVVLGYSVYDRAKLMHRRRAGDELAAVADLYRDPLNVFGYLARCVVHWRRHQIWVPR